MLQQLMMRTAAVPVAALALGAGLACGASSPNVPSRTSVALSTSVLDPIEVRAVFDRHGIPLVAAFPHVPPGAPTSFSAAEQQAGDITVEVFRTTQAALDFVETPREGGDGLEVDGAARRVKNVVVTWRADTPAAVVGTLKRILGVLREMY
jgi:hypothetical protein